MRKKGIDARRGGIAHLAEDSESPDLNPEEGIWDYLKRVELANVCCRDLADLRIQMIRARERLRHKHEVIQACSRQCGYLV